LNIDPRLQQDADEFLVLFLDRLEAELKGTRFEVQLRDELRGALVNQILGQCGHLSETSQPTNVVPVDVKEKANLEDSLRALIAPEVRDQI
jgi:hypothetical protein